MSLAEKVASLKIAKSRRSGTREACLREADRIGYEIKNQTESRVVPIFRNKFLGHRNANRRSSKTLGIVLI